MKIDRIKNIVIKELGDSLKNLSERRKKKIIERCIIIYTKASNEMVYQALDVINNRINNKKKGSAEDKNIDIKE